MCWNSLQLIFLHCSVFCHWGSWEYNQVLTCFFPLTSCKLIFMRWDGWWHASLFCTSSSCKFRLASSSCIFLLQVFLGLSGGRRPDTTTRWVFPKLRLLSSHNTAEPPQPSNPQHITQLPHPIPPHSSHDPSTWLQPYTSAFFYHN